MTLVRCVILGLLGPAVLIGGCLEAQRTSADAPVDADIVQVLKFYEASPWLSFDEAGDPNPEGFKVTVYLISAKTQKGAFGDGDIEVMVYSQATSSATGKPAEPVLEKRWVLNPDQARPFRSKQPAVMGYGYGLRLNWGDVDLLGKTISVQIDFRRRDGRLVRSSPQWLRVPAPHAGRGGY